MAKVVIWDKCKSQKLICSFLLVTMLGMFVFQATSFLSVTADVPDSNVCIETIDNNTAKIHYNNTNSDILVIKELKNEGFNYTFLESDTKNELCSFNSKQDINLNDAKVLKNNNINAVAWAIINAVVGQADVMGAIVAVLGGLGDIAAVGALASELAAVATIGGWTGVKLCVAILLSSSAAVPIIAAGGGVF